MTSPVNAVSNPVRQVRRPSQCEPYYACVIVIKTSIMRCHDGVVFRHPLQFFRILHPTRHNRIRIHGPISGGLRLREDLVQRDQPAAAKFRLLEAGRSGLLRVKQRRTEILQGNG